MYDYVRHVSLEINFVGITQITFQILTVYC